MPGCSSPHIWVRQRTTSEIARRAYEILDQRGCEHGHDVDDSLQAERELRGDVGTARGTRPYQIVLRMRNSPASAQLNQTTFRRTRTTARSVPRAFRQQRRLDLGSGSRRRIHPFQKITSSVRFSRAEPISSFAPSREHEATLTPYQRSPSPTCGTIRCSW